MTLSILEAASSLKLAGSLSMRSPMGPHKKIKYRPRAVYLIYIPAFVKVIYKHRAVNLFYSSIFVLPPGARTEEKVIHAIKTLGQLSLILKGFRKEKGLTQAAMAERLGITQQSYAYFEANPASATLERLFLVLRMLGVEISLDQPAPTASKEAMPSAKAAGKRTATAKAGTGKAKPSAAAKAGRIAAPARKKESW